MTCPVSYWLLMHRMAQIRTCEAGIYVATEFDPGECDG